MARPLPPRSDSYLLPLVLVTACFFLPSPLLAVPAFPGAEGFGAEVTGGRGGTVVEVTRLDDPIPTEPGTLRYALMLAQPRIVVFRVGGVIRLSSEIRFVEPNVTIAGQTAPGSGICIDGSLSMTSNSVVRYIRVRQSGTSTNDGIEVWGTDFIIDHCSISWCSDENIGFHSNTAPRNATVQWCIISENLKGILACLGTHNVSFHHNLFTGNYQRNPLVGEGGAGYEFPQIFDIRNNVVYNSVNGALQLRGPVKINVVGNYFKMPDPTRLHRYCVILYGDPPPDTMQIYLDDIYGPRVATGEPEWNEVRYFSTSGYGIADEAVYRSATPFSAPPVTTHDAQTAYDLVLADAGTTLPRRDSVDERLVGEVQSGTRLCIPSSSESYYRAFAAEQWSTLTYENGTPPDDSDHDGMADSWETDPTRPWLDPNDPSDGPLDYDGDGYTNVEEYLNSLVPQPPDGNHQPIADAGPDQAIDTEDPDGADVQLDGSGSSDPDDDPLSYRWTWEDADGNPQEAIGVNPIVSLPCGETVVSLSVNDGSLNSVADTVTVTVNFTGDTNATYYVDPDGDDSNPGTIDQPWATVKHAYSTVTPGDTVYFREGTYVLNDVLQDGPHGTTEAERTLFASYEGESVVWDENELSNPLHLNCDYVTIEGIEITNGSAYGIELAGSEIIIRNCKIHDHGDDIIKVLSSSPHCVIEACELYGSAGGKCVIDAVGSQGLTIRHNYIHDSDSIQAVMIRGGATDAVVCNNLIVNATMTDEYSAAISLGGATAPEYMQGPWECMDSIAYNNVIVNTSGQGLIFWDANNCAAFNNTLLGVGDRYGVRIFTDDLDEQTQNITFKNNIVHCVASANHKAVLQVDANSTIGLDIDHNLWFCEGGTEYVVWGAGYSDYSQRLQFSEYQTVSGQGVNSIVGDPLLTDDYHLTADSPAIDAGTYELGVPSDDFDGNPRPYGDAIDIGAYEYMAAGASYAISGTILDTDSNPVADVTVTAASHSAVTAADGTYTIQGLNAGTYTVTPALAGYGFAPESVEISVGSGEGSATGVDFVAGSIFTLTVPAGLSLIGVPCTPLGDSSPGSVFTDAPLVVRWDPIALQYVTSDPGAGPATKEFLAVAPSKGYFVYTSEPHELRIAGEPAGTAAPFAGVGLSPGWNMVANPFNEELPFANFLTHTTNIRPYGFTYDSEANSYRVVIADDAMDVGQTSLLPGEGIWVCAVESGTLIVEPPTGTSAQAAQQQEERQHDGWTIPIVARTADCADLSSLAGVTGSEVRWQVYNPPSVADSVDVYFVGSGDRRLAHDLRPGTSGSFDWDFVVSTDIRDAEVAVSLPDLSRVPADLSLILEDRDVSRAMYVRTMTSYTFRSNKDGPTERHFRLSVRPRNDRGLVISTASAHPTGAAVRLAYSVSRPCSVSIRILNIAGRLIERLCTDRVVPEGTNMHTWDLCSQGGSRVPSGLYLVSIEAKAENGQRVRSIVPVTVMVR